jgi:hypothetical protein
VILEAADDGVGTAARGSPGTADDGAKATRGAAGSPERVGEVDGAAHVLPVVARGVARTLRAEGRREIVGAPELLGLLARGRHPGGHSEQQHRSNQTAQHLHRSSFLQLALGVRMRPACQCVQPLKCWTEVDGERDGDDGATLAHRNTCHVAYVGERHPQLQAPGLRKPHRYLAHRPPDRDGRPASIKTGGVF